MTMQELRFFSIYLSKINQRDSSTRIVRFQMDDFKAIMDLGRIDIGYMKRVTNALLCKVVNVPTESGGYVGFQLFKKCKVDADSSGEWYVEIDAHDEALPLMFEYKTKYFKYELWNALRLKSSNQLRMYEILKQYQAAGERVLKVEDLKALLGVGKNEYPRFGDFKNRVLDACQQALSETTDIKFTYEPHGKKGKGGKIIELKFIIEKNEDYIDQLTLWEFIEEQKLNADGHADHKIGEDATVEDERTDESENPFEFFSEAFNGEFSLPEVEQMYRIALPYIQSQYPDAKASELKLKMYDYFMLKLSQLNAYRKPIKSRIALLVSFIKADAKGGW